MNRRDLLTAGAAILALAVSGGAAFADPVELRFFDRLTTGPQTEHSKWLVEEFNKQNEGKIKVSWEGVEDEVFKAKINSVLRTPNAPDVFFSWEGGQAKYMIDSGYSAPLDEYYTKYGWDKTIPPAGLNLATFDGVKYFVPTMMSASIVWYHPDIFEKYGIAVPKNWDELMAAAKKLKDNGITPFMLANQQRWPAQFMWSAYFVNKNGVQAYNDLIARKIPWTDPRVVDAFAEMKRLMDDGYFEQGANGLDVTPAVVPFAKGDVAMWYQGSFMTSRFVDDKGNPKFSLDYFPLPQIGDVPPTLSVFAENTLMINANSEHKDEAAAFLNFVLSKEAMTDQTKRNELYPANIDVDLSGLPPLSAKLGKTIASYDKPTFMHVDHAISNSIADPYLEALQAVLAGKVTPEDAAKQVEDVAVTEAGPVTP